MNKSENEDNLHKFAAKLTLTNVIDVESEILQIFGEISFQVITFYSYLF